MADLTIRNLDENLKRRLRRQAYRHGLSIEEEARVLLADSLARRQHRRRRVLRNVANAIAAMFNPLGDVEANLRTREPSRRTTFKPRND